MSTVNLSKQTVNLSKGQAVNLSKQSEGLKEIMIGLGWDAANHSSGGGLLASIIRGIFGGDIISDSEIDCDAWILLQPTASDRDIIYYNNLKYRHNGEDVIIHHGDNLIGGSKGDDEQITIHLDKIPKHIDNIVIAVTIYRGKERGQSFDVIKNTRIRVVDKRDNFEICKYEASDFASDAGSITFIAGQITKTNNEWEFKALGYGTQDGSISKAVDRLNK